MRKIKITVSGERKTGKSDLIKKIQNFLKQEQVFNVEIEEELVKKAGKIYQIIDNFGEVTDSSTDKDIAQITAEDYKEANYSRFSQYKIEPIDSLITLKKERK